MITFVKNLKLKMQMKLKMMRFLKAWPALTGPERARNFTKKVPCKIEFFSQGRDHIFQKISFARSYPWKNLFLLIPFQGTYLVKFLGRSRPGKRWAMFLDVPKDGDKKWITSLINSKIIKRRRELFKYNDEHKKGRKIK